jgi:folate-binding protein YgfZ
MNSSWRTAIEQSDGQVCEDGSVAFGEIADGLAAAQAGTVVAPLTDIGLIRVSGEDATAFLQNLLTNDTQRQRADQAQYNALCSAKGRMLANFIEWREGPDYLLQLSRDLHAPILKKLSMFVLRSKVNLSDAGDDYCVMGVAGGDADTVVETLGASLQSPMSVAPFADGTVIRLDERRYQVVARPRAAAAVWQRLATRARAVGTEVWHWLDIVAGIPRITGRTQEEFVPQMANFELIGGVSFKKGCYPGQEIVARTQYLGKLKRRMYLANMNAPDIPQAGDQLYSPDLPEQSCGMVVNAAPAPGGGSDLLAVIQMTSADGGDVHLGSADGPRLHFKSLPYALN